MIYLDSAATTKIDQEVLQAMMPYLTEQYGNAGTLYDFGRKANCAVQKAREQVAGLLGCKPEQIIFTSGGSEANSLVFLGLKKHLKDIGKTHILVSAVEHDSVIQAAESLRADGFNIEYLPVNADGRVSLRAIKNAICAQTGLVSVMYVNNETGVFSAVGVIKEICRQHHVLFHTDCVQAAGCLPINTSTIGCDFLSISSHKIHGCKGVGALFAKDSSILSPIICGGKSQEFGLRGGTENVAGIVGFGKACELTKENMSTNTKIISGLCKRFCDELRSALINMNLVDHVHINGGCVCSPGKILNLRVDGVDSETLLLMLDSKGVCVSAGSACRSRESKPSRVLIAMGLTPEEARSSIRVSFSYMNNEEEIICAARILAKCIQTLRGHIVDERST